MTYNCCNNVYICKINFINEKFSEFDGIKYIFACFIYEADSITIHLIIIVSDECTSY